MNNIITANFYPGKCPGMPVCSYATDSTIKPTNRIQLTSINCIQRQIIGFNVNFIQ